MRGYGGELMFLIDEEKENCNTATMGHAVKSGKFFYYMCGNARRRGRGSCKTPLLLKDRIESFIVDRIEVDDLESEGELYHPDTAGQSADRNGGSFTFRKQRPT